jgi:RecB family endonuclease NucS
VVERQLEDFLLDNWERIDWGRPLTIWEGPDGTHGHQYLTEVGRIDLLCIDASTDALVVVELKRGHPSDRVVGQTARYMGWVQACLARPGQAVEGLIVSHETDDQLAYAASAVPGLRLMTYELTFELRLTDPPGQRATAAAVRPAV